MALWVVVSLVLGLCALGAASTITSPLWIDALAATGGCLGFAAALTAGLALRRALGPARWKPAAALLVAVAAVVGRRSLVVRLEAVAVASVTIDFWRLALAVSTVIWAGLALVWGALALSDALEGRPRWVDVGAAGAAVSLSLYGLAPLWKLLGLAINHWTLLGLIGVAVAAYAAGALYRRLTAR